MTKKTYVDFDLLIEQAAEGYTIHVLNSPAGQAKAQFTLPFEDSELKKFFVRIGHPRSAVHRDEHIQDQSDIETVREFGTRLFKAIFKDRVRDCLSSSLHETGRQGRGLRIRLRLVGAPQLADIPWEYLYTPSLDRFLALSVDTPIVRYLALPEGIKPLKVELPLNVLVMISSPRDYPSLDVNKEWDKLKDALRDLEQKGLVTLKMLESATLSALQHQLLKDEYHVFHFIGHGGFDKRAQDGVLILEDEEGNGRLVNGQKLGTILHDERTLRLVVLNACDGARTSRTDPFAGTAQSLVQQGIPAVIAMQFEITDSAAITLSHTFYLAAARGYPVDFALAEARKAINSEQDSDSMEWGTPVLYMRSPDGNIFNIDPFTILRNEARDVMQKEDWKTAVDKWQAVLALVPEDKEAKKGLNRARWMKYRQKLWIGVSAITAVVACALFCPKIFPAERIDLAIASFSVEPDTVIQGDTVQVTALVQNSGNADATDVVVRWWPDAADTTVYVDSVILEIGGEDTVNVEFRHYSYPDAGEVITKLTVNPNRDITESNENNNSDTKTITVITSVPPIPSNLEIDSFSIEPGNPTAGNQATMRATIHNSGDSLATSILVEWWPDTGTIVTPFDTIISEIGGGQTEEIVFTYPGGYPNEGEVTTKLTVNSGEDIPEGDYSSIDSTRTIEVLPGSNTGTSDTSAVVEVAEMSIEFSSVPQAVTQEESFQVTALVRNSGNADASNILVEWWPVAGSSPPLTETIPVIERENTAYVYFTYPGYPRTELITTELRVNSNKATTEVNDHNNSCTTTIEVTSPDPVPGPPDLEIASFSVEPSNPIVNTQVTMRAGIRNAGETDATNVTLKWWPDVNLDPVSKNIGTIEHGATKSVVITSTYRIAGNNIVTEIEVENDITESNEDNNSDTMPIDVRSY